MHRRSFVLVPGAGGNAGFWQLVEPLISEAGFHSVAVSLPNWPGATFADHADAIVAAAGALDDVTLVAQSMGAFSAPLTCDRLPVSELVLLNAMIPAPGETAGEWWGNTGQADAMRTNELRRVAIRCRFRCADLFLMTYRLRSLRCWLVGGRGAGGLAVPDPLSADPLAGRPDHRLGWP